MNWHRHHAMGRDAGWFVLMSSIVDRPKRKPLKLDYFGQPDTTEIRCPICRSTLMVQADRRVCRCTKCRTVIRPCRDCEFKDAEDCQECRLEALGVEEACQIIRRSGQRMKRSDIP